MLKNYNTKRHRGKGKKAGKVARRLKGFSWQLGFLARCGPAFGLTGGVKYLILGSEDNGTSFLLF
jgi:hypothetical protein